MYKHNVSHNDIKSDNILINNDTCNYIDFLIVQSIQNKFSKLGV